MSIPADVSVDAFNQLRVSANPPRLLDVREDDELATAAIAGAHHIPMDDVPDRLSELRRDEDIVVMCHHGGRSAKVTAYLRGQGFTSVANLEGGIDAWSLHVDPSVPRY